MAKIAPRSIVTTLTDVLGNATMYMLHCKTSPSAHSESEGISDLTNLPPRHPRSMSSRGADSRAYSSKTRRTHTQLPVAGLAAVSAFRWGRGSTGSLLGSCDEHVQGRFPGSKLPRSAIYRLQLRNRGFESRLVVLADDLSHVSARNGGRRHASARLNPLPSHVEVLQSWKRLTHAHPQGLR